MAVRSPRLLESSPPLRPLRKDPSLATPTRARALAIVLLALAAVGSLAGCSTATKPLGTGDFSGLNLVAFASDRGNALGQYDIFLLDLDTSMLKGLPGIITTAPERHPSISSDGRFIAYQVDRGLGDRIEVYDRRNQTVDKMTEANTGVAQREPAFSGDGGKLVFTQVPGGGSFTRIRLFNGPTRSFIALPGIDTTGTYNDYSPTANYDASLIAFVSTRITGTPHVYIYDRGRGAVLGGPKLDTDLRSGNNDIDPSFSQYGQFLAFASDRAGGIGGYDVCLVEFRNSGTQVDTLFDNLTIANTLNDERHPAVSSQGRYIVFQSQRPAGQGRQDLWDFDRSSNTVSQPPGLGSAGDDIEPSVKRPN